MLKNPIRRDGRLANASVDALEARRLFAAFVVTSTADTTAAGTLRAALVAANSATTTTTITFDPVAFATPKTITLAGTQLTLTNTSFATTVTGPAAGVTISGNDKSRVFQILTNVTATMSNVTITKGAAVGTTVPTNRGGGIENYGKLTLFNSSVVGNRAIQAGGGINEDFPGVVTLTNVTIAGNTLSSSTGTGGGISAAGTVTLNNVTVSGNTAARGGGMCINNAANRPFTLANSIVAQNNATSSGQGDGIGAFVSKGHNLIGSIAGSSGWIAGDYTGTAAAPLSAKLGTLANNGGATFTLLPLTGSPAIDKGSNALVPAGTTKDQRGQARVSGTSVDIGAVEVQVPTVTLSAPAAPDGNGGPRQELRARHFRFDERASALHDHGRLGRRHCKDGLHDGRAWNHHAAVSRICDHRQQGDRHHRCRCRRREVDARHVRRRGGVHRQDFGHRFQRCQ